jgi:hypothetical protein
MVSSYIVLSLYLVFDSPRESDSEERSSEVFDPRSGSNSEGWNVEVFDFRRKSNFEERSSEVFNFGGVELQGARLRGL